MSVTTEQRTAPPVVTATAVLSPLAADVPEFAAALLDGRSAVRFGPGEPVDGSTLPAARLTGFDVAGWADAQLAAHPESARRLIELVSRLTLPVQTGACVAVRALLDTGLTAGSGPVGWAERTGLLVAGGNLAMAHIADTVLGHARRPGRLRASYALTHLDVDVLGAVSELTGIAGEGAIVGGASASGAVALIQAARTVATGELDRVLVVAPATELSPVEDEAFRRSGAMAYAHFREHPERMCRPFDEDRQGFVRGEGAAALLVESPAAARERGAPALVELAGHGQRLDARRGTAPDVDGEVAALRAALRSAGVTPEEVDYVNAHGTGSQLGDRVEATALRQVFSNRCAPLVNSTKPLTGHCLAAAAAVEVVATIAQMQAGACHPNPNLHRPIDTGLALVGRGAVAAPLRVALCHSVAFGGINAALVLRRPAGAAPGPSQPSTPEEP
jgi:malonyl-ACP decarboxylase